MSVFCVRGVDRGRRGDHRSRARAPHNLRVQVPGRAPRPSREGGGCPISLALCLNSYPKGLDERYPRRTSRLGHLAPILFRMLISATTPLLAPDAANTPVRLRAVSVAGGSKPPLSPPMECPAGGAARRNNLSAPLALTLRALFVTDSFFIGATPTSHPGRQS
jgi:hypothetical protein